MCGCNADGPGDGGVPGSPPGGTTGGTALCCACPASDTVSQQARGRYFTTTGYTVSQKTNKCTIDIQRTATGGTVTINTSFSLSYVNGATAGADSATVTGAISSAMTNWTGGASSYKLRIEQTTCQPQELTIVFTSSIVASDPDVAVTVDGTSTGPSTVTGGTSMSFKTTGSAARAWTMTHETGHTFGLPDEYSHPPGVPIVPAPTTPGAATITVPTPAPTTSYIGAPTQGNVTITHTPIRPSTRNPSEYLFETPSVMGESGNTTYPKRLFYWVAIEVRKILADANTPATVTVV